MFVESAAKINFSRKEPTCGRLPKEANVCKKFRSSGFIHDTWKSSSSEGCRRPKESYEYLQRGVWAKIQSFTLYRVVNCKITHIQGSFVQSIEGEPAEANKSIIRMAGSEIARLKVWQARKSLSWVRARGNTILHELLYEGDNWAIWLCQT